MMQKNSSTEYRYDIQGMRGLAVLGVLFYHFYPNLIQGGFVGVDIFFVISGYLITEIIFQKLDEGTFSAIKFYAKRLLRLIPALVVVLTFVLILGYIFLLPREYKALAPETVFGILLTSNIYYLFNSGYFDTQAYAKPLLNLWSLGVEGQFYLLWPAILLAVPGRNSFRVITICLLFVFSVLLCFYFFNGKQNLSFYLPFARIWEFSTGALCALIVNFQKLSEVKIPLNSTKLNVSLDLANQLLPVLGFVFILISFFKTSFSSYPYSSALLPIAGASILLLSKKTYFNKQVLSSQFLGYFGQISYSLYLWHWPLLSIALIVNDNALTNETRITIIFLSVALATATYQLIEIKFTQLELTRRLGCMLIASFTIIITASVLIYLNEGYKNRFDITTIAIDELLNPQGDFSGKPNYTQADIVLCDTFDGRCNQKGGKPTIAFIGDSHMGMYMSAINKYISRSHIAIQQTLCLPFATKKFLDFNNCRAKQTSIINYLDKNGEIDTVVLGGFYEFLSTSTFTNTGANWRIPGVDPKKPHSIPSFIENADVFLKKINGDNRRIIIIGNVPTLNFDIRNCVKFHPLKWEGAVENNCSVDYVEHIKNTNFATNALREILKRNPNVIYYDVSRLFCDDERCYAMDGNIPMYFNGDHLNTYGADVIFRSLVAQFNLNSTTNKHD